MAVQVTPGKILLTNSSFSAGAFAGKLSPASRESSVVSTEMSAASPKSLEVKVCAVIQRSRLTPEGVRL